MIPNIKLTIDQLVLEGFTRKEAYVISRSLQTELHRLIENGSLQHTLTRDYHQPKIQLSTMAIRASSGPEGVGRQIAQSIFSGLSTDTANNQ